MKKLIPLLFAAVLCSCEGKNLIVKRIEDGAVVRAVDRQHRDFKSGDTVCIKFSSSYLEYEVSEIIWKDTVLCFGDHCNGYEMAVVK